MIRYIDNINAVFDRLLCIDIEKSYSNRHYRQYLIWLADGNVPLDKAPGQGYKLVGDVWVHDPVLQKEADLTEINHEYYRALRQPVECTYSAGVIIMDGNATSAVMMRRGLEFAELMGHTTMDLIDYYDKVHVGISLDDVRMIMLQQASYYYTHYMARAAARSAILTAGDA